MSIHQPSYSAQCLTPNAVQLLLLGSVNSEKSTTLDFLPCKVKVTKIRCVKDDSNRIDNKDIIAMDASSDDEELERVGNAEKRFKPSSSSLHTGKQDHNMIISSNFYTCQIEDGTYIHQNALIFIHINTYLNKNEELANFDHNGNLRDMVISVDGYISSRGNYMPRKNKQGIVLQTDPFLCITSFKLCSLCNLSSSSSSSSMNDNNKNKSKKVSSPATVRGSKFGTFMQEQLPFFTHDDLVGMAACNGIIATRGTNMSILLGSTKGTNMHNIQIVADFISYHKAKMILSFKQQQQKNSSDTPTATATATATSNSSSLSSLSNQNKSYIKALSSFATSQLNRQVASLVTNAGREVKQKSENIVNQHSEALLQAIEHATSTMLQSLTKDVLCQWHGILGAKGIVQYAGKIRKKRVRAGSTLFIEYKSVETELDLFCNELRSLEQKLFGILNVSSVKIDKATHLKHYGLGPILFAAIALFGVVELHPFNDGNGRIGRLVANWALHRGGLPFVINICATPIQRAEYVTAIELTRRNITLQSYGKTSSEMFSTIHQGIGLFKPLFDMILDRVYRAIDQCQSVINEKVEQSTEEMESKAVRRYLEKASKGTCLICFDDKPNIATLCCGKAVHINCIAEWLSTKTTCPTCRGSLPILERKVKPENDSSNGEDDTVIVEEDLIIDDTTSSVQESVHETTIDDADDQIDETEDTDSTTIQAESTTEDTTVYNVHNESPNEDTTDDTTSMAESTNDDTTSIAESTTDDTTSMAESTTDDTTDQNTNHQSSGILYCICCNNRAAMDCVNGCCGRCCVLHGQSFCVRHNS